MATNFFATVLNGFPIAHPSAQKKALTSYCSGDKVNFPALSYIALARYGLHGWSKRL
jgi:hypothetical protein